MGAGVGPHGPADRARDGQAELEAGQAGALGLGRGAGHRHAGLGRVAVAVDLRALGAVLDDEAADPAVADDEVAPPPSTTCGSPRDRANRTSARSSKALWTVANRSAGPPTRIVVNRASGSSRDVLTPIRRWMSVPIAMASNGTVARSGVTPDVTQRLRASGGRSRRGSGSGRRSRGGDDEIGDGIGGAGSGQRAGGGGHRGVSGGVVEDRGGIEQGGGVEGLVVHRARRARLDEASGVGALMARGMRVGHDDHRQPEGGHLGERRRARPPDTRSAAASAWSMSSRRNGNGR